MFPHCNKFPLRFNTIYLPSFNSIYLAFPLGKSCLPLPLVLPSNFFPHPSTEFLPLLPLTPQCSLPGDFASSLIFILLALFEALRENSIPLARIQDSLMEPPGPFGSISRSMAPGRAVQLIRLQSLSEIRVPFPSIRNFFLDFLETRGLRAFI